MATQILVVDDDPLIWKGLKFNLEQAGYEVKTATNSRAALEHAGEQHFDAAILDISMPGDDGLALCRQLKAKYDFPILFLTARRRELDEIVGLEVGADDYITKPFSVDVLLARLKAVLRRGLISKQTQEITLQPVINGAFFIDPVAHRASLYGHPLELAPREFDLLYFFLAHPDRVFSTGEIIERVWGPEYIGEPQVLYVQIRSLREKIEPDPSHPRYLLTLRGVGYKFLP